MFPGGFEKAVVNLEREGEVALVASGHERQEGQVVAILMESTRCGAGEIAGDGAEAFRLTGWKTRPPFWRWL